MSEDNYLDEKLGNIRSELTILDDNWYNLTKDQFYKLLRLQQQLSALCNLVQTQVIGVDDK